MQIKSNGIYLEYEEYGPAQGTPLVLIRGLGSQLVHWPKAFIEGFVEAGYRTIIFDNRDAGLSARCAKAGVDSEAGEILAQAGAGQTPPASYYLDDMANDVIGLLDGLGIERAHIFGISMGGAITQLLAINHAPRLLSAIMVMTTSRQLVADRLPELLTYPQTREKAMASWLVYNKFYGSPGYPMADADVLAEAGLAFDRGQDAEGINRQTLAMLNSADRRPMLKSITLPCLVIHGADDRILLPELGREISELIPGARYEEVPGMGHVISPKLSPLIVEMVVGFTGEIQIQSPVRSPGLKPRV